MVVGVDWRREGGRESGADELKLERSLMGCGWMDGWVVLLRVDDDGIIAIAVDGYASPSFHPSLLFVTRISPLGC